MEIFKIYKTLHLNQIFPYYPRTEAYTGLAFVPEIIQKKKQYPLQQMSTENTIRHI